MNKTANFPNILKAVSEYTNVDAAEILGKSRSVIQGVVLARFFMYSILRDEYGYTYTKIGELLNRKHNSVMYAIRKIKENNDIKLRFENHKNNILANLQKYEQTKTTTRVG